MFSSLPFTWAIMYIKMKFAVQYLVDKKQQRRRNEYIHRLSDLESLNRSLELTCTNFNNTTVHRKCYSWLLRCYNEKNLNSLSFFPKMVAGAAVACDSAINRNGKP